MRLYFWGDLILAIVTADVTYIKGMSSITIAVETDIKSPGWPLCWSLE